MAYIMCKWCYGTGFATPTDKCKWCYGTGCDRQATEKAGMAVPTGFAFPSYAQVAPGPDYFQPKPPLPTYKAGELDKMPDNHFSDLALRVKREMERRTAVAERELAEAKRKAITPEDRAGFHNFLAGVIHAMACRQALRVSKGHKPFGPTPQSGEMWNALEGARLSKLVFEEQGEIRTNPLFWNAAGTDMDHWLGGRWGKTGILRGPKTYGANLAANRAYGF